MARTVRIYKRGVRFWARWEEPSPRGSLRKTKRISLSTDNAKVAETRRGELQTELDYGRDWSRLWWTNRGDAEPRNSKPLADAIGEFDSLGSSELRPKSAQRYRLALEKFQDFCKGQGIETLSKVDGVTVDNYKLTRLKTAPEATVAVELHAMSTFFKFSRTRNWIQTNPCDGVKRPKVRSREVEIYSQEDLEKIFGLALETDPILWAKMKILLHTGVRKGEFVYQRVEQVRLNGGEPHVYIMDQPDLDFYTKTEASRRRIDLNSDAVEAYEILIRGKKKQDLVAPSANGGIDRHLLRQIQRLGEKVGVRANVHRFRHTFATRLFAAGVNHITVSELLGHADPEMTARVYLHPGARDRKEAVTRLAGIV